MSRREGCVSVILYLGIGRVVYSIRSQQPEMGATPSGQAIRARCSRAAVSAVMLWGQGNSVRDDSPTRTSPARKSTSDLHATQCARLLHTLDAKNLEADSGTSVVGNITSGAIRAGGLAVVAGEAAGSGRADEERTGEYHAISIGRNCENLRSFIKSDCHDRRA